MLRIDLSETIPRISFMKQDSNHEELTRSMYVAVTAQAAVSRCRCDVEERCDNSGNVEKEVRTRAVLPPPTVHKGT